MNYKKIIKSHIDLFQTLYNEKIFEVNINYIINVIIHCFKNNRKLLIMGNGGSAADSQHIAAEFVSKFNFNRKALPALALTTDTSILTSISNDFNFSYIFARQIESLANEGDILLCYTTSGKSSNIIEALKQGKNKKCINITFCGNNVNSVASISDFYISIPSNSTARIQEAHITLSHIICEEVEKVICQ